MSNAMTVRCSSGIYSIRFRGRLYIGSAADIQERWRIHSRNFRLGKHHSRHLQRAFNKFPDEQAEFGIVEYVSDPAELIEREQFYLDLFQPFGGRGYNSCRVAGSVRGLKWNEQSRLNSSEFRKGLKFMTAEQYAAAALKRRGKTRSAEARAKSKIAMQAIRAARGDNWGSVRGIKKSAEQIETMRENARKQKHGPMSAATKEKIRIANSGKKRSPETLARMSAAARGIKRGPLKPETIEKLRLAHLGRKFSAEHCANISAAKRGIPRGASAHG